MSRALPARIAVGLFVVAALAVCSGSDDESASDPPEPAATPDLTVVAESLKGFDKASYAADAGNLTIAYVNDHSLPHTLVIDDVDGFFIETGGDERGVDTITLDAGTYTLFCDIAGHRQAGMEAALTVR
ncbi:MAG TPA: hypothetical protein VI916_11645 [Acidimicrobiia bacterium]|nr:hypothetical protein [Acidimicrobiia bacterium]